MIGLREESALASRVNESKGEGGEGREKEGGGGRVMRE